MFKAIKHPPLFRLWIGQALSSVGDEIYRVGLTWIAIGLIGADTGYLAAGQAAALMTLSFVGGRWADQWDALRLMIRTDLARMLIVLIPVIYAYFFKLNIGVLWVVALSLSGLSAFFDPALQSCLPKFSSDLETLRSANGLMSTTVRLARMVGPAIVGLLAAFVPMIHFFTLDAATFAISALSVYLVIHYQIQSSAPAPASASAPAPAQDRTMASGHPRRAIATKPPRSSRPSFSAAIRSGFEAVQRTPGFGYVMWARAITGGTWNLAVTMGFALLVHHLTNGNPQAFGLAIASYGLGNFLGALVFGNLRRSRSEHMMYWGYILLGIGFIGIGSSPSMRWVLICAPFAGFCGPINDLAFIDMVQDKFAIAEIPRIFRFKMAIETAATLLAMSASPTLFKSIGVGWTIVACGLVWVVCGLWGLRRHTPPAERACVSSEVVI